MSLTPVLGAIGVTTLKSHPGFGLSIAAPSQIIFKARNDQRHLNSTMKDRLHQLQRSIEKQFTNTTLQAFQLAAMAPNEDIALRESRPSGLELDTDSHDTEQNMASHSQSDMRQWESKRKRASVLAGSAISQLPIWGKFT